MNANLTSALDYQRRGLSVLPVLPHEKRPYVEWGERQERPASASVLRAWWAQYPKARVGIVTGAVSGLANVDLDGTAGGQSVRENRLPLPLTPCVKTPRGGWHCYYRHPGAKVKTVAGVFTGLDIRGDGGFVVLPPSVHPNGHVYEWAIDHTTPLATAPSRNLFLCLSSCSAFFLATALRMVSASPTE